jgi:hypothetical protein
MFNTRMVIAIAKTPSESASTRLVFRFTSGSPGTFVSVMHHTTGVVAFASNKSIKVRRGSAARTRNADRAWVAIEQRDDDLE